jgi:glycosyltransferase involved in cell wall biosynthesis
LHGTAGVSSAKLTDSKSFSRRRSHFHNPLRIAFATLSEDPTKPTGSLDFFQQTIAGLAARDPGNEYYVLVSGANRHLFESAAPNVRLVEAGASNERRLSRILSEQCIIPRLLRLHRIDVFFTSSGGGTAPVWIPSGTKLVLAVYATQQLRRDLRVGFLRSIYRRWLAIPSLKRAARVIVNSQTCLDEICTQVDVRDKATVIHHGIDRRRYHDGPLDETEQGRLRTYGLNTPFILFLSTIYYYKNVHTLVEAFGRLVAQTGLPHELVLVGRLDSNSPDGGDYCTLLRKIARQHGVEERVRFIGPVPAEDLRAFYKMADVYVQPSFYETFGKTVVEAFCCGCPVIGSNTAATPEIIGDAGMLFDPHKPAELVERLHRLLTDESLRRALIARGRLRTENFTVEREIDQFIRVFRLAVEVRGS